MYPYSHQPAPCHSNKPAFPQSVWYIVDHVPLLHQDRKVSDKERAVVVTEIWRKGSSLKARAVFQEDNDTALSQKNHRASSTSPPPLTLW